jgi:GTP-binding protein Era
MQRRVELELADSDAVLFVVNGQEGIGPGDRFISKALLTANADTPVLCAVNKADRISNAEMAAVLSAAAELDGIDEVFPLSAKTGDGLDPLVGRLAEIVPEGPFMFPAEQRSDLPSQVQLAELIREQVLRRTREELPHAVEVEIDDVDERDDGLTEVHAHIWAETESQKGILIGAGGSRIKEIGTAARRELERELGTKVFLDLQVRVRAKWRRDDALLDRLGID